MQFPSKSVATKLVQHYYIRVFFMFKTVPKRKNITQRQRKPLHNRICYHLMQWCFTKHAAESCGTKLLSQILIPLQGIPEEAY